ncbi:MAG: glycosyltransferase family 4 protein [Ignavibacteriales bacterium]|nr:glycosyltransferase family 4 protein [Ignavibacteriales bacterium]
MIRILHLQTELNLACGITRTVSQIIKNSASEFEHHLIALGGDGLSRFEDFNFNPKELNLDRFSVFGTLKIYFFLLNFCKKHSIQIIHSHHRSFDTIAWLLKPFLKVKTITSVQSKVYGKNIISYKADKLIACSNAIKKHLMSNFNLPENRIEVIYNSVDPAELKIKTEKDQLKSEIGINLKDFVIGFVGRINYKEKGVDVLLKTFGLLSKVNLHIHLLIVGDGPDYDEAKNFYAENKLKLTIISSQENIFDYYNLMDVVVLPSRIEPFGIVVLEAGLINKPFIGSNVDGIAELIEHEKDGLLFESGNEGDLLKQIIKIIDDKNFADLLSKNLYKKVLECFTVKRIIPQYEKLYRNILNDVN